MPRRYILFAFVFLFAWDLHAQGFNTYSGRNHPELDWQVAETEHFRIMYPAHLAGIEAEAAAIAETTYAVLSANLGVTFDERLRIYLSDEDDISNGFAMPFGAGHTDIWVHTSDVDQLWSGREKWLRKVLAHELAHLFHYRAVHARPRLLNFLLGNPLPRFWTEGLAQYETEQWDAQRGDRWLRAAVLDDRLSYADGRSLWNGRLLYAIGNSQVRYFADRYGDSTLARLLAHRRPALFGLAKVHDLAAAFPAVAGRSYRAFYDDWRRHVNVYYNLLAAQMASVDSFDVDPLPVPGQYLFDVQYSPDTSRVAVVALPSLRRPVRRLLVVDRKAKRTEIVAEGGIKTPVAWSPDGRRLAFARTARGRHGSVLTDLFVVGADGGGLRRLTYDRRALSPTFAPDGRRLAFVASERGTANVFILDLETGEETQATHFTGDVQLASLRWHPREDRLVFARFTPEGTRDVAVLDLATGAVRAVTPGEHDDRAPVWSPDGSQIAYTSLRDDVPNVFVYDPATGAHRRVTHVVTGATVHDWLPPDPAHAAGSLVVVSNVKKSEDRAYRIDAAHSAPVSPPEVPEAYAAWTTHRPPVEVPSVVPPAPELITRRGPYRSWRNLTHVASLAAPYYAGSDDWGFAGFTSWMEPLGKHLVAFAGSVSLASFEKSFFSGSYVNNQWHPTLIFSAYHLPGSTWLYTDDLLVEAFTGGEVAGIWPLDWTDRPYTAVMLTGRLRFVGTERLDEEDVGASDGRPLPENGEQADLLMALIYRRQRPYADNVVHPIDGFGARVQVKAAAPILGADSRFVRGDVAAYGILRSVGLHRLFAYGRMQAQTGTSFAQDFIGFTRHDHLQLALPDLGILSFGDTERVRGYRTYAIGDRMLFGSLEYRMPLVSSLQTRLLGVVGLGTTTLAAFADAGMVWTGAAFGDAVRRGGVGVEVKNALHVAGFQVAHAIGVAQPAAEFGSDDVYEVYYRVRAAVPF